MKRKRLVMGAILISAAVVLSACGSNGAESSPKETKENIQSTTEAGQDTSEADRDTAETAGKGEYQKLTAEEAKKRIDSGDNLVILDVRTQEEYDEKHIDGAVLIPNEEIGEEPLTQLPDLNQEILIYCRSGNRSSQAAKKMLEAGYTNVYDFGGINDWPYDTVSGSEDADSEKESKSDSTEEGTKETPIDVGDSKIMESQNDNPSLSAFTTTDIDGNKVTQDIFKDHDLTMVNIWATFCGPCLREMPELGEINTEYADKGFQIVGIVTDVITNDGTISASQIETAKYAIEETGASYKHLLPSMDLLMGPLQEASVVPTTIFVDKEGKQVGEIQTGARSKEDWEVIIKDLLEQVK